MVSKEYHKYSKVFSEVNSHRLPQHHPSDHAIDLKLDTLETLKSKVYLIPHNEQGALNKFIEEQLAKGYICRGTWHIPCILFRSSYIFTCFIEPSRGLSCLCSVKAPFSASHHMCTSFLLLKRPSDAPAFRLSIGFFDFQTLLIRCSRKASRTIP
jgi:hypothetical protein